jgi:hypothetical protein
MDPVYNVLKVFGGEVVKPKYVKNKDTYKIIYVSETRKEKKRRLEKLTKDLFED